jgi:hypothetical protein
MQHFCMFISVFANFVSKISCIFATFYNYNYIGDAQTIIYNE